MIFQRHKHEQNEILKFIKMPLQKGNECSGKLLIIRCFDSFYHFGSLCKSLCLFLCITLRNKKLQLKIQFLARMLSVVWYIKLPIKAGVIDVSN